MVIDHLNFLRGWFDTIIKEERRNDIHNIYLLLCEVKDEVTLLSNIFREHIQLTGIKAIESLEQKKVCIE